MSMLARSLLVFALFLGPLVAMADELPKDTNKITSLTVEQALKLVAEFEGVDADVRMETAAGELGVSDCLPLNGLKTLDADVARALAGYEGSIVLNGLTTLSPEAAAGIAKHKGYLVLNGLTTLSPEAATALAQYEGGMLFLNGLSSLSPEVATALAEYDEGYLVLNGLTALDAATAKALATYRGFELSLNGVTTLSAEVAAAIKRSRTESLGLNGLTTLDAEAASSLAKYVGGQLTLTGLATIDADTAAALAECYRGGALNLRGLATISPEAAQALAECKAEHLLIQTDSLDVLTLDTIGLVVVAARKEDSEALLDKVVALDSPDAVEIAGMLAATKGAVLLPNLKRLSPKTFETLTKKEDLLLAEPDTLEFIPEPDGSGSAGDDVVIPHHFEERQRGLRTTFQGVLRSDAVKPLP